MSERTGKPEPRPRLATVLLAIAATLAILVRPGSAAPPSGFGAEEPWERLRPLIGAPSAHLIEPGQTLHDVAFAHRIGFEALLRLNPEVDPWVPTPGTVVQLPTRMIGPPAEPRGLVINVPEMRLYDFTGLGPPEVHAVAVGDANDPTPIAAFSIGEKRIDPVWRVPRSILDARPGHPERVPPGEDNPLGSRWMTLGATSYGIHGTNVRWSIGRNATHGCVRLYDDEMQHLFARVPTGTPVLILYAPYKWGTNGKDLFLEVHPDPYDRISDGLEAALELPRRLGILPQIDRARVSRAVEERTGIPIRVGSLE